MQSNFRVVSFRRTLSHGDAAAGAISYQDQEEASAAAAAPFRYGGRLAYTQPNTPDLSAVHHRRQQHYYQQQQQQQQQPFDDRRPSSKHVSFDATSPPPLSNNNINCPADIYVSSSGGAADRHCISKSQERLLDGRKTPE